MSPPSASRKNAQQAVIIKRVKKGGHGGHHGGAWKIAYADFVTAMMAFFLLMWLLGSTTQGDLKGIADYFSTPLKVAMGGGRGTGESTIVMPGGGADLTRPVGSGRRGNHKEHSHTERETLKAELERREREDLMALARRIEDAIMINPKLAELDKQIRLDLTLEGLRIQIVDEQNRPMFDTGSAQVKDYMRDLLRQIGLIINEVPHRITLAGHTDPTRYSSGQRGYSNWELSADRANASRRELVAGGLHEDKLLRVVGLADALPLDPEHPDAAINRRISITVMNADAEERVLRTERIELLRDATQEVTRGAVDDAAAGNATTGN